MSDTTTKPEVDEPSASDDEIAHTVCCDNHDIALCGVSTKGEEADVYVVSTCSLCVLIEDIDPRYCPWKGKCG